MIATRGCASPLAEQGNDIEGNTRHDRFVVFIGVILGGQIKLTDEAMAIRWHDVNKLPEDTYIKHAALIGTATSGVFRNEEVARARTLNRKS